MPVAFPPHLLEEGISVVGALDPHGARIPGRQVGDFDTVGWRRTMTTGHRDSRQPTRVVDPAHRTGIE